MMSKFYQELPIVPADKDFEKVEQPMVEDGRRRSGISVIGSVPWGTHFCQFYKTKEDLLELLVPYFKEGLLHNEYCMWVLSSQLNAAEAEAALRTAVPDLDRHHANGQLEIISYTDWYRKGGAFEADRVLNGWVEKLNQARAKGFEGLRLTGDTFWLEPNEWQAFSEYEEKVNNVIGQFRMVALCTYSLEKCGASEVVDVVSTHQFALIRRENQWDLIESSERRRAEEELRTYREHLEELVDERTSQLRIANEQLQQEITRRTQEEEARRASEQTFRVMATSAHDAVILLDHDGKINFWNPAAERILGRPAREALGKDMHTWLVPVRYHGDYERGFRQFRETGTGPMIGQTLELSALRVDGTEFPVEVSVAAVQLKGKWAAVGILRDISERKQMAVQVGRLERMAAMGQLLSGIAHELRNPLFILTGGLQLCQEKLLHQEYATLPADLERLRVAADRMAHITDRFLSFSRPYQPQSERCVVQTVLSQTLEFLANELMKKQIIVQTTIPSDLPAVWTDPRQLHEVFMNLMMNAMQAMVTAHGRGTLTVSAQRGAATGEPSARQPERRWIEVRIQDDGPGIPPEHRAKLFEPFFTTKPLGEGTGLGLWNVRTIVATLKGTVEVETEVGRGATFIVRLPVEEATTS